MTTNHTDNITIAVVATGPSLKKYVIEYIKKNYKYIICVSNSYEFFKDDCLALVSSDGRWWDEYEPEVHCDKYCLTNPSKYPLKKFHIDNEKIDTDTNSGCFALKIARKIYKPNHIHLFGFDMNNSLGDHYFGPHKNLKNTDEKRFDYFKKQFDKEALNLSKSNILVLNFNQESHLDQFVKIGIKHA